MRQRGWFSGRQRPEGRDDGAQRALFTATKRKTFQLSTKPRLRAEGFRSQITHTAEQIICVAKLRGGGGKVGVGDGGRGGGRGKEGVGGAEGGEERELELENFILQGL